MFSIGSHRGEPAMGSPICREELGNITLVWDAEDPVLSQCARQTLLRILPCAAFWMILPLELTFKPLPRHVPWSWFQVSRITTAMIVFLLSGIELSLQKDDQDFQIIDMWAAGVIGATFASSAAVLYLSKIKGFIRSPSVWIMTAVSASFGLLDYYFLIKQPIHNFDVHVIRMMQLPVVLIFLFLCSLADKVTHSESKGKPALGDLASFPSFFTFSFMNGLIYSGYRNKLTIDDMDGLHENDRTQYLGPKLWRKLIPPGQSEENGSQKAIGVGSALIKSFWKGLLITGLWKLISDLLAFASPVTMQWLLDFISSKEPTWHGAVIILIMLAASVSVNFTQNQYMYGSLNLGLQVRTALMSVIYRKALTISNAGRRERTVGEVVNLMSVDTDRFNDLMSWIHLSWASLLQITISMALLYRELGYSVFAGLLAMLLVMPINAWMAGVMESAYKERMERKDERCQRMNEIVSGIKVIKLYAWEKSFMDMVTAVRNLEINSIRRIAYMNAGFCFTFCFTPILVTVTAYAVYVLSHESHILIPSKVFFSLSIFNILRENLVNLPYLISNMVSSYVSLKRLNTFFAAQDLQNYIQRSEENAITPAVSMKSALLRWTDEAGMLLEQEEPFGGQDVELKASNFRLKVSNFEVVSGSLVAIVGVVGSGKSSLMSALLGEMTLLEGEVKLSPDMRNIGYVPQQPWIQNKTLRDNILFGKQFEIRKYYKIQRACELKADVAILPAGDQTEIGEKGISLSESQKQRLSLARSCYADADLYLLDDALSAVDATVAKTLFHRVLSSQTGLLKEKTRILVTNDISVLPAVDQIFVLTGGCITESGSYDELVQREGAFAMYLKEFGNNKGTSKTKLEQSIVFDEIREGRSLDRMDSIRISRGNSGKVCVSTSKKNKLMEEESEEDGTIKWTVTWTYFKKVSCFPLVIIFLILYHFCDTVRKYWLSLWSMKSWTPDQANGTDSKSTSDESFDLSQNQMLFVYGGLGFLNAFFLLLGALAMARGTTMAAIKLHEGMLQRVLRSPMSFFETTPVGRIMNRFSKDMESVDKELMHLWLYFLEILLSVLKSVVMILVALPLFAVVIFPFSFLFLLIQRFYITASRQFKRLESTTRSPINSMFAETLSGISTIRAFAAEQRFQQEADATIDTHMRCSMCSVSANRWLSIRLQLIGNLATFFTGVLAVINRANSDPGLIGLAIVYSMDISFLLNWLIQQVSFVEVEMLAMERISEYLNLGSEAEWESQPDLQPDASWPAAGEIEFHNYSTRYGTGLNLALKDVFVHIQAGEKVGIVGRTGIGKSTITLSLFRIIEASSGTINIDGLDTSQIGLHDLRSRLTIIPQDPVLFSGSLRMNMDPVGNHTDDQLWTSLELSHLKEFVASLEGGLEYEVSEGGENLNMGQRRQICLARAVLRKTKILILDETAAAVDLETDALIQRTIRSHFADCTVITVAHRISTIIDCDRVIVMDGGSVREHDTPNNLLRNQDSLFSQLAAGIVNVSGL